MIDEKTGASRVRVGIHVLADFHGCPPVQLQDETRLMTLFHDALVRAGFHILDRVSHKFPGEGSGVTGMFLVSQSHVAFHTYPERRFLALDLFTCGDADPDQVVDEVGEILQAEQVTQWRRDRGRVE